MDVTNGFLVGLSHRQTKNKSKTNSSVVVIDQMNNYYRRRICRCCWWGFWGINIYGARCFSESVIKKSTQIFKPHTEKNIIQLTSVCFPERKFKSSRLYCATTFVFITALLERLFRNTSWKFNFFFACVIFPRILSQISKVPQPINRIKIWLNYNNLRWRKKKPVEIDDELFLCKTQKLDSLNNYYKRHFFHQQKTYNRFSIIMYLIFTHWRLLRHRKRVNSWAIIEKICRFLTTVRFCLPAL